MASFSSTNFNARRWSQQEQRIVEVDCTGTKTKIIILIDGKDGSGGGKHG